jgi:hypothetical protein
VTTEGLDPFRLALDRTVLGAQLGEELPALATDALVCGLDGLALRELAGLRPADHNEAPELLMRVASELGLEVPTPEAAGWRFVRRWAADLLDGRRSPIDAARLIWWEGWERLGRPESLTPFVGLASEWEDDPAHRAKYEDNMKQVARRVLATAS